MKIVKLIAENVKRLHAIEITPEGSLITVGGKNGAGKSSVLDSIAYAMGGEKLVPSEPIRAGESEAKIIVDLGDLIVTRQFKRKRVPIKEVILAPDGKPEIVMDWGAVTSTLTVTNKDGARYPSPQAVLDKLLGRLTFDPLAFARDEPKRQDETLRKLVNLDVASIEARRKDAFERRAILKKSHAIKEAQLQAMPFVKEAPATEIPMDIISQEMLKAEKLRKTAEDADRAVEQEASRYAKLEIDRQTRHTCIEELNKQIAAIQAELIDLEGRYLASTTELASRKLIAEVAYAAVPNTEDIRIKIKSTEVINAAVRANQRRAAVQSEVEDLTRDIALQHESILKAEQDKKDALTAAKFPIEGLGISDDGVTFNGLPFAQAGSAEQVRISVAIGIALNPQLKVLLIRNGNMLDSVSLAMVAEQAKAADMQVWMEYVSESKDGVAVMLVDGEVA